MLAPRICQLAQTFALLVACALTPAHAQTISGRATVIDGETLEIRGTRIRLYGIDVPADDHACERTDDLRWRCGPRAMNALGEMLEEAVVSCLTREKDDAGRLVAVCSVGPVDVGLWLVRNGLARARPSADGRYGQAQEEARAARRGSWAGQQNSD
ncbi:thermonuclease family protein [Bradyrhizobium sp. LHD-71]|uniref:thermonuclease family protein n=1 Tax=Bradyrhizobium sp. LHD-71 TaxID=3072141 RepID=UPI00280D13CD|nr:thermonuclease family protein [Bradyrhizobium sp. LHD-71]MDQ8732449.1 thermonuclease family protein [Bradyrhizobium sp. LHD-71]